MSKQTKAKRKKLANKPIPVDGAPEPDEDPPVIPDPVPFVVHRPVIETPTQPAKTWSQRLSRGAARLLYGDVAVFTYDPVINNLVPVSPRLNEPSPDTRCHKSFACRSLLILAAVMVVQGMLKASSLLPDCHGPMDASSLTIESRGSLGESAATFFTVIVF
jgi:hypothetical protein